MKKQSKLVLALLIGFPVLLFTSCGNEDYTGEEEIVKEVVDETINEEEVNETYYQIPSPDEMFGFIKESGVEFNGSILNTTQNVDNYTDRNKQALNFGIYSADMAYTASFEEFDKTIKYFGVIQKLADKIDISTAFNEELLNRIKSNLDNVDSLVLITNTSYFSVVDHLEQNEQGDKLGLISSAGWIETLYVVVNTTDFNNNQAAVERLADQKLILDNLLGYLDKYADDKNVSGLLLSLKELETVFAGLEETDSGSGVSFKKKDDGNMVLGGGTSITMTEDEFNLIKDKINEIRNSIVNL